MAEARGRVRVETGTKRVRAYLGGRPAADTTRPLLVWESPHYPTYYLPLADVAADLDPTGATERSPSRGTAEVCDVRLEGATATGAALRYTEPALEALRGRVRLDWQAMEAWFEEDEEVFVHPRDPYVRIDALRSTRHVVATFDGAVLADSHAPVILYETGLPPRHYLPATDVRLDLLTPSATVTHCPYKGSTRYFDLHLDSRVERDLAWSYPTPLPESRPIAGLVCLPAERVDLTVDGRPPGR